MNFAWNLRRHATDLSFSRATFFRHMECCFVWYISWKKLKWFINKIKMNSFWL